MIAYGAALAIGLLIFAAVWQGWVDTMTGRIIAIVFALAWLVVRYVIAKKHFPGGWRGKRKDGEE